MGIENITSTLQPLPMVSKSSQHLSKTDLKTHAIVVLSYLLIGIGLVLAFCAPYFAFTVQPMIAMASPVLPIAIGVFGLQNSSKPIANQEDPFRYKPVNTANYPLNGIRNPSGGNCWINSSLQFLFNVPDFRKLLEEKNSWFSDIKPLLKAFDTYKKGGEVDSQELRLWLCQHNSSVSDKSSDQDDPFIFLEPVLKKLEYSFANETEVQGSITLPSAPLSFFYFSFPEDQKIPTLTDKIAERFFFEETLSNGKVRRTLRNLDRVPEDFSVGIHRGAEDDKKKQMLLKGTTKVSLSWKITGGENADYVPDCFINHEGSSRNHGHYVAYVFREGQWYRASDSSISPISMESAEEQMKLASLIHYQKVPSKSPF